jgi:putative DNA primase/helicase
MVSIMANNAIIAVLGRFEGCKATTTGWQARCPAHDDHVPSLSIRLEHDKFLLHCHAGCDVEDILQAAGLQWKDLFLGEHPAPKCVATYSYRDENRELVFQILRYEPKDFKARQPGPNGEWVYNLNGVRRVPYQLQGVVQAKSSFILEGEKDVDEAREMKFSATYNPGGAGKWREEYGEHFRGKGVFIVPDDDEPGLRHARTIARSLFPIAKFIKLVHLPRGKDFAAWHELGGTREEMVTLCKNASRLTSEEIAGWQQDLHPRIEGFQLSSLAALMDEPEEKVAWTVKGVLPAGGISLLVAKPKTGKSTLARKLAVDVAQGSDFLGKKTHQGPVIYLALEEKRDEVRKHFDALGVGGDEQIYVHCAAAPQDAIPALIEIVKEKKPQLLIIDPILRMIRLSDANDYARVNLALEPLVALAREFKTHVLMVYHLGKGERADAADQVLGSTAFYAAVDTLLIMKRTDRYRTIQSRQRYGEDLPETVLEFDTTRRSMSLGPPKEEAEARRVGDAILQFLATCKTRKTEPQIDAVVEGRTGVKRAALRSLVAERKVLRSRGGSSYDPYMYEFPGTKQTLEED